jgi:hypothetical protein
VVDVKDKMNEMAIRKITPRPTASEFFLKTCSMQITDGVNEIKIETVMTRGQPQSSSLQRWSKVKTIKNEHSDFFF